MTFVIPLAVAAALTVFGLMAGKKNEAGSTPALPPGPSPSPGTTPPEPGAPPVTGGAAAVPSVSAPTPDTGKALPPAPSPGVMPSTGAASGAISVSPTGAVDDAFDALVAAALAKGDVAALEALAKQAEARGLLDVARSIREEEARLTMGVPKPTAPGPNVPVVAPVSQPTGRAVLSMAAGSKGPDVVEWQNVLKASGVRGNVVSDGIFGANTDSETKAWQKNHGLTVDGIVGPKCWALAYQQTPALATTPRPPVVVAAPTATHGTISRAGPNNVEDVKAWQKILGLSQDGIFGEITDGKTKTWQQAHGLLPDGIVGPHTWAVAAGNAPLVVVPAAAVPAPQSVPPATPPPVVPAPVAAPAQNTVIAESDSRLAARELTQYLGSNGGLSFRFKESRPMVSAWLARLGIPDPKGLYGRDAARAVMQQGFVPVVPFYWPTTGASQAKKDFLSLVSTYSNADPQRASQWASLVSDVNRA